jgi:1-aminocyclopropane-1-carboxylate deaminase/D-cysteine desulfhydrase-like pyridoxal-dependent ACC family enzyme
VTELSPMEWNDGLWLKREDLYTGQYGINGSKLRACQHLLQKARSQGFTRVVTACSVLSPQSPMVAVTARELDMDCLVIYGGSKPSTAFSHPGPRIAQAAGADFDFIGVGYNPALQRAARELVSRDGSAYLLHYGITTPPTASRADLVDFHAPVAEQVANLPDSVRTLIIPFGSANTATGILLGLVRHERGDLDVKLIGIGPDRREWMRERLQRIGIVWNDYDHIDLHGTGIYSYGDKQPYTLNGVVLHPTYEGKVASHLDRLAPDWWTKRDGTTCLWIVGGPL